MTTLVAIKKKDKIILASDSRSTSSSYIFQTKTDKIVEMGNWCIALSGLGVYKSVIRNNKDYLLQAFENIDITNILEFTHSLRDIFFKYGIERVKRDDETFKYDFSGIIVTNKGDMFYINGEPDFVQHETFVTGGSGSAYAEGALAVMYDKKIRLEAMAEKAILVASSFDTGTDMNIDYITYDLDNEGQI